MIWKLLTVNHKVSSLTEFFEEFFWQSSQWESFSFLLVLQEIYSGNFFARFLSQCACIGFEPPSAHSITHPNHQKCIRYLLKGLHNFEKINFGFWEIFNLCFSNFFKLSKNWILFELPALWSSASPLCFTCANKSFSGDFFLIRSQLIFVLWLDSSVRRFCSCALAFLLNFVHALSHRGKKIFTWRLFQCARLFWMYTKDWLIHLNLCLINSFRSPVALQKSNVLLVRCVH